MFSPSRPSRRPPTAPVVVTYEGMHPALMPIPESFFPNLSIPSINRELVKLTSVAPHSSARRRTGLQRVANTLRARRTSVEQRLEEARLEEARAAAALEEAEMEARFQAEMELEAEEAEEEARQLKKEAFNARMNNANNLVHRQHHTKTKRGKKGKGKGKKRTQRNM